MAAVATQGSTYEVIEITGRAGGTIDLRLGVSSFQYFEDIMSPVVTAVMGVVTSGDTIEGQGIYSGLPIVGGEKVRIHITSPIEKQREESPGVFELTMYVNKISDYKMEKQRETFILHLVSKEGIVNMNKRILKKYKQKRIDEVIKDFLDILEADYEEENIGDLLMRVDIIPISMAISQAVVESGWGTSRYSREANAIFGQYTFDESTGILPEKREENKKHFIKKFLSISESVSSYIKNLNTHFAYEELRKKRRELRMDGKTLTGEELISYLSKYSERGKDYIADLQSLLLENDFARFDKLNSSNLVEN